MGEMNLFLFADSNNLRVTIQICRIDTVCESISAFYDFVIHEFLSTAKQGSQMFGSVCISVCLRLWNLRFHDFSNQGVLAVSIVQWSITFNTDMVLVQSHKMSTRLFCIIIVWARMWEVCQCSGIFIYNNIKVGEDLWKQKSNSGI